MEKSLEEGKLEKDGIKGALEREITASLPPIACWDNWSVSCKEKHTGVRRYSESYHGNERKYGGIQ